MILQEMPYFKTRLSERWEEADRNEALYLRLPEGCTVGALAMLLERLHFKSGSWGHVNFATVLQMAQLAGMFLADGDGLLLELSRLLRSSVCGQADVDLVTALVGRIDAPAFIAELAASFVRPRLSVLVGDEGLSEMLRNVLASGDASTAEAVEKILSQRARRDADFIKRNASVLQGVLQVGPALVGAALGAERLTVVHSESAGRWSEWVERPAPGLQHVLQITTKFVLRHPEYLASLAPLMLPQFPVNAHWTRSALVTDLLKRTVRTLFDGCFIQRAGTPTEACQDMGAGIASLIASIIANGHEDLLYANASLASAIGRAAGVSSASVALMCGDLLKLKSAILASFVTAEMLRSICGPSRQQVCLAIMPNMHTLGPDVKVAVLLEIEADDSGSESSASSHASRGPAAKRQRGALEPEAEAPEPNAGLASEHQVAL